jgi:hypothetical protein
MPPQFRLLRRPSHEATDLDIQVGQAMTCGYRGRFAGPKRCRTIQAVMVAASMRGIAVGLAQLLGVWVGRDLSNTG